MKMIFYIFIFSILSIIKLFSINNDLTINEYKGHIKEIIEEQYSEYEKSFLKSLEIIDTYDKNGINIRSVTKIISVNNLSITVKKMIIDKIDEYRYSGTITSKNYEDKSFNQKITIQLDQNKNMINKTYFDINGKSEEIYKIENNRVIEEINTTYDLKTTYIYDQNGKLKSRLSNNININYFYNDNGLLINEKYIDINNKEIVLKKYEYQNNVLYKIEEMQDFDGVVYKKIYSCDSYGNIIKKEIYEFDEKTKNFILSSYSIYKIIYYKNI